jgi:ribosome-binding protein aMBF1 (putative translation factor)
MNHIKETFENIPKPNIQFIQKCGLIADRIDTYMEENGLSEIDLAHLLNIEPKQLNDWVSTSYNFTLKEICIIEDVVGEIFLTQ